MTNQRLSEEEIQFRKKARRRLVGSVFSVLVAAGVLPMLLGGKPKPVELPRSIVSDTPLATASAMAAAPAVGAGGEVTGASGTADAPAAAQGGDVKPPAAAPARETAATPRAEPQKRAAEPPPRKAAKPAAPEGGAAPAPRHDKAAKKSDVRGGAAAGGHWIVQVGVFANIENASLLKARLAAGGLPVRTETVQIAGASQIRVRLGPFSGRAEAQQAMQRLDTMRLKVAPRVAQVE